jgi:hypothetical protein
MAHLIRELDGTRDLLPLAAAHPARYPGLFESVARGNARARYDVLCLRDGEHLALERDGVVRNGAGQELGVDFLDALDARWRESRIEHEHDDLPPFRGGWLLYLGYELAAQLEPSLRLPRSPDDVLPTAFALRCPAAIVVDHERARTLLVAETGRDDLIECMLVDLEAASPWRERPLHIATIEEDAPQRFLDGVARVHEHLRAGDVFQVNLSRAWRALRGSAASRRRLRRVAPRESRAVRGPASVRRGGHSKFVAGTTHRDPRRPRADTPDRGHAPARRGRRGANPRTRRAPEGARRARHAHRPRAQRPWSRLRARQRRRRRAHGRGKLRTSITSSPT